MQFSHAVLDRVATGELDLAFRRWRRPTVREGTNLRTAIGLIAIGEVSLVDPDDITDDDARRAGHPSRDHLLASLRSGDDRRLYRVAIGFAGDDPRVRLREAADLAPDERDRIIEALRGIDARSRRGPWTTRLLALLADNPGRPSRELAAQLDRDQAAFKSDVRRLKDLGLTRSLDSGYELSPRGTAVLDGL